MNKLIFAFLFFVAVLTGCQKEPDLSEKQHQLMTTMAENIAISISDYAVHQRKPTNSLLLLSLSLLDKAKIAEYQKNGYVADRKEDIDHAVSYVITDYTLINEKGQKLTIVAANEPHVFEKTGLHEKEEAMYQVLISPRKLTGSFSTLTGSVSITLTVTNDIKKTVTIPVNIAFWVR